jgi:type II secretory pathway component PulC
MKRFVKGMRAVMPGIAAAMILCAAAHAGESPSLILTGTVVGTGIRSSAVLMDASEGKQYMVYEGDHVGGAKIESIKDDRIILLADGQRQTLMLRGRTGGSGAAAVPEAAEEVPTLPPDLMPPPPPPAPAPVPAE